MTHTYAELGISNAAWDEIAGKLREAGYDHVFMGDGLVMDMHGIALVRFPRLDTAQATKFVEALVKLEGEQPRQGQQKTWGQKIVAFIRDGGRHPNY